MTSDTLTWLQEWYRSRCDGEWDYDNGVAIRLLKTLVESGVRFVVWHGSNFHDLPMARVWNDVLEVLKMHTRLQPTDLYLRFSPPDAHNA
jgi:hypothetical protein